MESMGRRLTKYKMANRKIRRIKMGFSFFFKTNPQVEAEHAG